MQAAEEAGAGGGGGAGAGEAREEGEGEEGLVGAAVGSIAGYAAAGARWFRPLA